MRLIVQRVSRAAVSWQATSGAQRREIGRGLAILAGAGAEDSPVHARRLAAKVASLRTFPDDAGRSNRSLLDVGGAALVVSQFTLYADLSRGRRPSFIAAGEPQAAAARIEEFVTELRALGVPVETGEFAADMTVEIVNDGPVTYAISTDGWNTLV